MIEFIIYDESEEYLKETKNIVENSLMNYDYNYKITSYSDFNEIKKLQSSKGYKVYILDIKARVESGIDLAKYIREKLLDWQSMIIFTSTLDYQYEILNHRLMMLNYLKKDESYPKKLTETISLALKNYDTRPNTLRYNYKNVWYNIALSEIIYIEKEQDSKRCLIKTLTDTYYTSGNLCKLEEKLDKRFLKCNRSYIINLEQVQQYNTKSNIIKFNNQETLNIISRTKRKEIIDRLRYVE